MRPWTLYGMVLGVAVGFITVALDLSFGEMLASASTCALAWTGLGLALGQYDDANS